MRPGGQETGLQRADVGVDAVHCDAKVVEPTLHGVEPVEPGGVERGPEFKMPNEKGSVFVHGLFGFAHDTVSADILGTNVSVSDNAFATALGGGYDWKASDVISVRLFQFDYLMTRFGSQTQNNIRLSFGVTFHPKFGRGL